LPVTSIAELGDLRWRSYSKNFFESTPGRLKKLDIPKTDAMSPGHKASTGLGAEKVGFVIPNPRRLRVRDLLFARKPRKKQIPHPVQKPSFSTSVQIDRFRRGVHVLTLSSPIGP